MVYAMRIKYNTAIGGLSLAHEQKVRVLLDGTQDPPVGSNPDDVILQCRTVTLDFSTVAAAYVTGLLPLFPTGTTFEAVTLWNYPSGFSGNGVFVSASDPASADHPYNLQGTATNSARPGGQATYTFRTGSGGIVRNVLLEAQERDYGIESYASIAGTQRGDWVDYLTSPASPVRDKLGFPIIGFERVLYGQNEVLFRKRFR